MACTSFRFLSAYFWSSCLEVLHNHAGLEALVEWNVWGGVRYRRAHLWFQLSGFRRTLWQMALMSAARFHWIHSLTGVVLSESFQRSVSDAHSATLTQLALLLCWPLISRPTEEHSTHGIFFQTAVAQSRRSCHTGNNWQILAVRVRFFSFWF